MVHDRVGCIAIIEILTVLEFHHRNQNSGIACAMRREPQNYQHEHQDVVNSLHLGAGRAMMLPIQP